MSRCRKLLWADTFIPNWSHIKVRVPQSSIQGALFFLVYINDLPDGLTTNAKLFTEETSLFLVVHDSVASSVSLNNDLLKFLHWLTNRRRYLTKMLQKMRKRLFLAQNMLR